MSKDDIIQQWRKDQESVNPEALGWEEEECEDYMVTCWSNDFSELQIFKSYCNIFNKNDLLFTGKISNQGELRILMKMLGINDK